MKKQHTRILAITVGSTMAAMIFKVPLHWEHCSMSMSNTRLSSRAQLMRASAEGWGVSPWSAAGVLALTGAQGSVLLTSMSAADCFIGLPAARRRHRPRDLIGIRHWVSVLTLLTLI
ncbi:MAG: hypothetical protein H0T87_13680 [Gammaproteobacteria bacterium]|nr:hypothetical protein [Gammaproteobacteria bacterium]